MSTMLIFHATLNKKVVPKYLGDGPIFLQFLSTLSDFLRECIEEIQSSSVRIQYHIHRR
jgi:hypothetical protein